MLYSVNFLRFLAAVVVVVSHSYNALAIPKQHVHLGDVGVDVFFVISGLVIGLSTKDGDSPVRFALKRFVRIAPMYWLATFAMLLFSYSDGLIYVWGDIWRSLAFVTRPGEAWFPVIFPGWTLSYEAFFYLLLFAMLSVVRKNAVLLTMVILAGLSASVLTWPGGKLIWTENYIEFAFGLAISFVLRNNPEKNMKVGALCLAVALFAFCATYKGPAGPLHWGVPSAVFVYGVIQFESLTFFKSRLCVFLGEASYSIYLFHILIILIIRQQLKFVEFDILSNPNTVRAGCIASAIIGGLLIHKYVEAPLLAFLRRSLIATEYPADQLRGECASVNR
jgi:exopolysaccharide production protein ExoZ